MSSTEKNPSQVVDEILHSTRASRGKENSGSESTEKVEEKSVEEDAPVDSVYEEKPKDYYTNDHEGTEQVVTGDLDEEEPVEEKKSGSELYEKYKTFYEKMTAPIKISGKEHSFTNPDEIRKLVSKGGDYNLKMEQFKKDRSIAALVTGAGVDTDTLRILLDVARGEKGAILYCAKAANMELSDFADLDETDETKYEPKTEKVSEEDAEFKDLVSNVRDRYPQVFAFLRNLTAQEVEFLRNNLEILTTLMDHFDKQIFTKVVSELDRQKVVGELDLRNGWFSAYNSALQKLTTEGKFTSTQTYQQPAQVTPPQPNLRNSETRSRIGTVRSVPPTRRTPSANKGFTLQDIRKITDPVKRSEALNKFIEQNKR